VEQSKFDSNPAACRAAADREIGARRDENGAQAARSRRVVSVARAAAV
jgi:hypothetical protein